MTAAILAVVAKTQVVAVPILAVEPMAAAVTSAATSAAAIAATETAAIPAPVVLPRKLPLRPLLRKLPPRKKLLQSHQLLLQLPIRVLGSPSPAKW
jgi:hypothetical protein